jgi:hypothetical protein
MKITMVNDFHNTAASMVIKPYKPETYSNWHLVTKRQAQRIAKQLCGVTGCTCSDQFGRRGGDISLNIVDYRYDSYIVSIFNRND